LLVAGQPVELAGRVGRPNVPRSSHNRSTGGKGIRLAIAHQLAMAMGARLLLSDRT
jgi:hypothetical protein